MAIVAGDDENHSHFLGIQEIRLPKDRRNSGKIIRAEGVPTRRISFWLPGDTIPLASEPPVLYPPYTRRHLFSLGEACISSLSSSFIALLL